MLSHKVLTRQDIARAAGYYEDAADDYYAKEGEASEWQGRGAAPSRANASARSSPGGSIRRCRRHAERRART